MLANFHTHTTFCDGKNTPEEMILKAIEKDFTAIGFSSHGNTPFDLRYCMTDTNGYINEINRLKVKYKDKIQVYLGIEEDAFSLVNRKDYDYIIGSSHYIKSNGKYYPIDSNYDYYTTCLELFSGDVVKLAKRYYEGFCEYINCRKPDIVGHFDNITKFDFLPNESRYINNSEYLQIVKTAVNQAVKSECIFEVNTGAMAKKIRSTPIPSNEVLYELKKADAKLILSSDAHLKENIDYAFSEVKRYLYDIGFRSLYLLDNGKFIEKAIIL